MEPLFRNIVVGLVPQARQMPPAPFEREELQRTFFDVNRAKAYSQFSFLPGDSGAQLMNNPTDRLVITPTLIQFFGAVDSTAGRAREECIEVLGKVAERLRLEQFVQGAVDVTAHVPAPGARPDARLFVKEQLLGGKDHADELGAEFFAGGVKFRRAAGEQPTRDENLSVEPLVADNNYLWVNYNVQIFEPISGLDAVATWIEEAFDFVSGPAMSILEA
jgi:hypothetical protein